jgi:hypothetical protein
MASIITLDAASPVVRDLGILCNFTNACAVQSRDWFYNSMDSDPNQERTAGRGTDGEMLKVELLNVAEGQRFCLTTRWDAPGDDSAYIEKRCKFAARSEDPLSISFWFLIRKRSRYIESPLMLIFGHGKKHFLSVSFCLHPSGEFNLTLHFDDEDERHRVAPEDLRHRRLRAEMGHAPEDLYSSRQRVEMKVAPAEELLQTDKWYHTVALFSVKEEQSTVQFYLNGTKTNEVTRKALQIDANGMVLLRTQFRGGSLADVAVWSRELTPMEIELLYTQRNMSSVQFSKDS